MSGMKKIIESVPNFSEGRDLEKIETILNSFRGKEGVKLLDYQRDKDHNRLVVTVVGEPDPLKIVLIEALGSAIEIIDMRKHKGQHPRMGAIDVVPFIPVKNLSMTETADFSIKFAEEVSEKYNLPVFLYEESATRPERRNLLILEKASLRLWQIKLYCRNGNPILAPKKSIQLPV